MNKIALLLIAVLPLSLAQAQNNEPERLGKSDPEAEKFLDKVADKYKSYNTMRAVFTLTIRAAESGVNEERTGNIYIKGNKFKLNMGSQEIITDNTTLWTYLKDANEVQINYYKPDEESIRPSEIFTIYEKDFLNRIRKTIEKNGKEFKVVELTPKEKDKSYFKIVLTINANNYDIVKAEVFDKNGTTYTYNIDKFVSDLSLSDNFFKFDPDKHPDVKINDIR